MTNKLPTKTITMENIEEIYEYIFAPYVKQLKLSFLEIEEGRVVAKLENSRDYQFVTGAVSGQVLMSVIDTTMSIAMNTSIKSQRGTLSQNNNLCQFCAKIRLFPSGNLWHNFKVQYLNIEQVYD